MKIWIPPKNSNADLEKNPDFFFNMFLGGRGALKQLSEGKTESKLNIFCSGLIQRVSAMLPMSLPQTEYTNGHFMDNMHRFDIFLVFSITLHLRIIDFSMSGQLRTYVWTSRQKSGHMSGRPDKSPDIVWTSRQKSRHIR